MNTEQLKQWCVGKDVNEVTQYLQDNYGARFIDEKIDDGGDEEGTYVIKRVLAMIGGYVDLYYLNTEMIVSLAEINVNF